MSHSELFDHLDKAYISFAEELSDFEIPTDDRTRLSAGLFDLSHELTRAILILLSNNLVGAAFALVRSQFETLIRGLWLQRCANKDQLEAYQTDKKVRNTYQIVEDLEGAYGSKDSVLKQIMDTHWSDLCSFIHGGYHQAVRRIADDAIAPNYTDEDREVILRFSKFCFYLCAVSICSISSRDKNAESWLHRYLESEGHESN